MPFVTQSAVIVMHTLLALKKTKRNTKISNEYLFRFKWSLSLKTFPIISAELHSPFQDYWWKILRMTKAFFSNSTVHLNL